MKFTATLLLFAVTLLFILAKWLEPQATYWGYIAAFAEAGMIGAIADWFAVVALFKHPLGIPIPHTAIIPANRERIAKQLADFLCQKFIDTEQMAKYLGLGDPLKIAARWLSQPTNARKVAASLCQSIDHILPLLNSDRFKNFIQKNAIEAIASTNLAVTSKELLNIMVQKGCHQRALDQVVLQAGKLLKDEEVRNHVASTVANEVRYLRYIGLDAAAGRYATGKIIATLATLMEEMAQDDTHPFRQRFDAYVHELIVNLNDNTEYQQRLHELQMRILQRPDVANAFAQLWEHALQWLKTDCEKTYPVMQNHFEQALQTIGRQFVEDDETRQWLNQKIFTLIPQLIARHRHTIRHYIVNTVNAWTPEEMSNGIEKYVGRDLQFIRINGTLVGGLVGLLIYTVTQFLEY